jgi:hypothetical protein
MEMLAFGIRRPLTFHILMFSKTACPNEQKISRQGELKSWCKKKYSYNVLKFIFDMGVNQDLNSVLICINPDIWKVRM